MTTIGNLSRFLFAPAGLRASIVLMATTHFEMKVRKAQDEIAKAVLAVPLDALARSERLAAFQGKNQGLDEALRLYREAVQTDMDEAA